MITLKLQKYDPVKNQYVADKKDGGWCYIDLFVGCAVAVPTDPYDEVEYNRIANDLVGREILVDEDCWSGRHQMYLPSENQISFCKCECHNAMSRMEKCSMCAHHHEK